MLNNFYVNPNLRHLFIRMASIKEIISECLNASKIGLIAFNRERMRYMVLIKVESIKMTMKQDKRIEVIRAEYLFIYYED